MKPNTNVRVLHSRNNNNGPVHDDYSPGVCSCCHGAHLHHPHGNTGNMDVNQTSHSDVYPKSQRTKFSDNENNTRLLDNTKDNQCHEDRVYVQNSCQHCRAMAVAQVLVSSCNTVQGERSHVCLPGYSHGINHAYGTKQGNTSWLRILLTLLVAMPTLAKGKGSITCVHGTEYRY